MPYWSLLASPLANERRLAGVFAGAHWTAELTIKPDESGVGRGNRNCFFTKFVVKGQAYGAKRIRAFYSHPGKLERAGRDFSLARGVFRSLERPENESASRGCRDAARPRACQS